MAPGGCSYRQAPAAHPALYFHHLRVPFLQQTGLNIYRDLFLGDPTCYFPGFGQFWSTSSEAYMHMKGCAPITISLEAILALALEPDTL